MRYLRVDGHLRQIRALRLKLFIVSGTAPSDCNKLAKVRYGNVGMAYNNFAEAKREPTLKYL